MKSDVTKFDKKLTEKILPQFNNAKEWSDLMAILKNLKQNMKKYSKYNISTMSEKILLSKRLAQSLNPSLPGGLHEITLEVYDIIFENIRANNSNLMGSDLGLYSSGLFPFFQFATVPNKTLYLNTIIKKHYLELTDQELLICFPGFLVSILPGLDDQNETLLKSIKDIFIKTRLKVGDSSFFGILWTVILRTQRMRLVGMKYISEAIPIYKLSGPPESDEDSTTTSTSKEQYIRNYFPNLPVLVINSLTALIEDESVHVQRLVLDFIITRLPINNKILTDEEKIYIINSALNLLIKNDYSTTRRLFAWLLGSQEEELEMGDPVIKYMIELLTSSILRMFDYKTYNKERWLNGLKIIDQLFKQQVKLVDYILENISIDMITCIEEYWRRTDANTNKKSTAKELNDEILVKVKKFFVYDVAYLDCLWGSLANVLREYSRKVIVADSAPTLVGESDMTGTTTNIDKCIRLLKFCLTHLRLESIEKMNKYYIPIVSSLLRILLNYNLDELDIDVDNNQIKSLLVLALKFTTDMQEMSNPITKKSSGKIPKHGHGHGHELKHSHTIRNILKMNEQNFSMLESFKENIILYQSFYIKLCNRIITDAGDFTINLTIMKLFRKATELILVTQEYSAQDTIPEWVHYLIRIVFCHDVNFSLEGINYLLDLLIISSENEVYTNIKYYLRSEEIDFDDGNSYKKQSIPNFQTSLRRNCCELSMAKLWLLLEEQNLQKKVIDLLIKFYNAEQHTFSNTISNTFAINDLDQNVNAIKKFSQFWKLTTEYYPELIFFENGECIFKMLDFLDHEHPLLRHLSKSWLSQSVGHFNKILDPLLKVLLDKETTWFISAKKQLYFAREYDNRRIIEAFRKLKNIIINMTDLAINYFVNTSISPFLIEMDEVGRELSSVSRSIPLEHYLEMMVSISLRFIQGKFIESVSAAFYRENFSVNAASCEFLEFLLSFIEPKSKVMNIAELIAEPVLMILHETIMINDEVMQVQLLNLLKVLLFNTQAVHKDFMQQAVNIFNSQLLHDCITLGIQINLIFVRSHFISFVEYCLPIFKEILDGESNLRIANKLIITTSDFLVRRVKYYDKHLLEGQDTLFRSPCVSGSENIKFIIKNYLPEYKEIKTFDENDVHVILKGLKQILFHFIGIDSPVASVLSHDKINFTEFKKLLHLKNNSNSFKDYLGSLFSSKNFGLDDNNGNKKNSSEIVLSIFAIYEEVLASLICCWVNNSDQIMGKDLCLNENGILAYNHDEIKFQTTEDEVKFSQNKQCKNELLRQQIVNINMNLFLSNPFEYMNKFIALWLNEKNKYINKDKQYKLAMIELLVAMNLPMEVVLFSIIKNVSKLKEYKKSKVRIKEYFPYYLNKDQICYEAKICHLVYSYIIFSINIRVDKNIVDIWNEVISFFNIFTESKSPSTYFWILEILNILLHKLPVRETTSIDKTLRNKLILITTNVFTKIMELSINNKIDVMFEESGPLILPMNPSIYEKVALEVYNKSIYKIDSNNLDKDKINFENNIDTDDEGCIKTFYYLLYDYVTNRTVLKNEELLVAYRNIGFITLKTLFYSTMKNIYLPDKNDKMVIHIQSLVKNLIGIMNERIGVNKIYVDLATEFFHSLMINASSMTSNSCKSMIMDFFLEPVYIYINPRNSSTCRKNV